MNPEELQAYIKAGVSSFRNPIPTPMLHSPTEAGLKFENVFFHSEDGVPLEGWYIPAEGSNKLLIVNNPLRCTRSGYPAHLEPFKQFGGGDLTGNNFEINFIPDLKILHDAGYNLLAYDSRNSGQSGAANGGVTGTAIFESRDVVGSIDYARSNPKTKDMTIGLFSRCLGGAATFYAMKRRPEVFEGIRCVLTPQPISPHSFLGKMLDAVGASRDHMADVDREMRMTTNFSLEELAVQGSMPFVRTPVFIYQVKEDLLTTPEDVQSMFDLIPIEDKKLFWIEGREKRRWKGYTYFQEHPDQFLEWFAKWMN